MRCSLLNSILLFLLVAHQTHSVVAQPPEQIVIHTRFDLALEDQRNDQSAALEAHRTCLAKNQIKRIHIISDLTSISASSLYISSVCANSITLSHIGSGLYAFNFTLDHLLDIKNQIRELDQGSSLTIHKMFFVLAQLAELANISGFLILSCDKYPQVASLMVASGLSIRVLFGFFRMCVYGFESVFGDINDLRGFVQTMALENMGGALGSIMLAIGTSCQHAKLNNAGTMLIGVSVGLGSTFVLLGNLNIL